MFVQDYYAYKGTNNEFYHNKKGASGNSGYYKKTNAADLTDNYFATTGNEHTLNYYKTVSVDDENIYDDSNVFNRLELSFDSLF